MPERKKNCPLVLVIRDGWGFRESSELNAVERFSPESFEKKLVLKYPNALLGASGNFVGLPEGYQGNSEVGHLTIGAGRVLFESIEKINKSIREGDFFRNPAFLSAIGNCKERGSTLHIIGLIQKEGVHSHIDHLFAILDICRREGLSSVKVHPITDGRDAPVKNSIGNLRALSEKLSELGFGEISTISGRYYAMDRDKKWERTKLAYDAIFSGKAQNSFSDAEEFLLSCYEKGETDEFVIPGTREGYPGIGENDSVIFFNFRTDRTRQLTRAIVEREFSGFERGKGGFFPVFVGMTDYYSPIDGIGTRTFFAFPAEKPEGFLGEILSREGFSQLRISETEKYAHVTFFFNGQVEPPYPGEERILVPSPKVATYDLVPEMSADAITEKLLLEIDRHDVIIANLVNGDMVGHTGNWEATLLGAKKVDSCIERIADAVLRRNGTLIVTADHGNCEDMTPEWRTSHTLNPVRVIVASSIPGIPPGKLAEGRGLASIAPTILKILGIPAPGNMEKPLF